MGNFLVIISAKEFKDEAARLFRSGLEFAKHIKSQAPSRIVEVEGVHAASFSRQNGSGTPIVTDPETGSWLLAIGTWFHTEGYGAGAESQALNRYLEVGANRLARELEGFFVFVIGDARTRETIVLTDLVGSCHCFIRSWGNIVALSGSSLLLAGLGDFNLDPVGCQEFLYAGVIYEERTIYREVRKLGPASIYRFAGGGLESEKRYWHITDIVPESLDGKPAVKALAETLVHAAKRVGHVFERPVCDLTGGYDSRAIVAAFKMADVPFSTTVSGPAESPDVIVSRKLAQSLRLLNLHLTSQGNVTFEKTKKALLLTDGEYDIVEYSRVLEIHQTLSKYFDISLNGSFGEVARGYWWELLFPQIGRCRRLDAEKLARLRYAAQSFEPSIFPPDTRLDLTPHFTNVIERTNAGLSQFPNTMQMDHAYLMMRMQRWQGRVASSTNQIWPCLSLFIFRSVLETTLMIKANLRRRSLLIRRMLAEFEPRLGKFPLEHGFPALPVTWKNFYRFWPIVGYYRKRIMAKAVQKAGWRRASSLPAPNHLPPRIKLWREEEVRDLLDPGKMKLGCLADRKALDNFLSHSEKQDFKFNEQWTRMLTLEYTLRVLEEPKASTEPANNLAGQRLARRP